MTNQLAEPALYEPQELKAHPFADAFPMIEGAEFDELVQSVQTMGLHRPIMVFQGMILDGRNRYAALKKIGWPLTVDDVLEFAGDEDAAREFVRIENVNRRHLTSSQRAIAIMRLNGDAPRNEIMRKHGLSDASVTKARKIVKSAKPHIADMAERGEVTLQDAHKVSYLPKREQSKLKTPEQVKAKAATMARVNQTSVSDAERGFTRNRINSILAQLDRLADVDMAVIVRRLDADDRDVVRELLPKFGGFLLKLTAALNEPFQANEINEDHRHASRAG